MTLSWLLLVGLCEAVELPWRWVTSDDGLIAEHIDDVASGPDGMVWIATHAGVWRWDGRDAVRADDGALSREVFRLAVTPAGAVYARDSLSGGWWIDGDHTRALLAADGRRAVVQDLEVGADGQVWAVQQGRLWQVIGDRLAVDAGPLPRGARLLRRGPGGGWIVGTGDGFWKVPVHGEPVRLTDARIAVDAETDSTGAVWTLDNAATLRRIEPSGEVGFEAHQDARGLSLALRGQEVWAATDTGLMRVQDDVADVWGPERGVFAGGAVMLDAEGSVWLGTYRGLAQLRDPGSGLWDQRDGLPGNAMREVVTLGSSVHVAGWQGLGQVDLATGKASSEPRWTVKGALCTAGDAVWTVGTDGHAGPAHFLRLGPDRVDAWPAPAGSHFEHACVEGDGGVWLGVGDGLWWTDGTSAPIPVQPWPDADLARYPKRMTRARDGTLWVVGGDRLCGGPARGVWRCIEVPGRGGATTPLQTDRGALWVTSIDLGVLRLDGDALVPLPGNDSLPSTHVIGLAPSPRGGVWLLGHGVVTRVTDRPDLPEGWQVQEQLAAWLGHLVSGATDLEELDDGTLWIAHNGGLTRVDPSSRVPPAEPPRVYLQDLRVDGEPHPTKDRQVRSPGQHFAARFVAASHRAPGLLRYRVRLGDAPWEPPTDRGDVELRGLGPGQHRILVAASLDGSRWSDPPAELWIHVRPPWYLRWEAWAGLVALAALALGLWWWTRTRMALRTAALRTRIALDLHDEVGAGLGAIGLLSGMLGRGGLPGPASEQAAARIAAHAEELGLALRAIVWSLRAQSLRTDALGGFLVERARGLLADLDAAGSLHVEVSSQAVPVDLDVLRSVQRIGLEALHNVARHARASRVALTLAPIDAHRWRLVVEDDGVGLGVAATRADGGSGLEGMSARAREAGGTLEIGPSDAGGTRVALVFRPTRWPRWPIQVTRRLARMASWGP